MQGANVNADRPSNAFPTQQQAGQDYLDRVHNNAVSGLGGGPNVDDGARQQVNHRVSGRATEGVVTPRVNPVNWP